MAGQRVDDHGSWIGKGSGGKVFPDGAKTKSYSSQEGVGGVKEYPDTSELIARDQSSGEKKARSQPMKTGYRY